MEAQQCSERASGDTRCRFNMLRLPCLAGEREGFHLHLFPTRLSFPLKGGPTQKTT